MPNSENQYNHTEATGSFFQPLPSRRPVFDKEKREHFWVATSVYAINIKSEGMVLLDSENYVMTEGPGCFFCCVQYAQGMEETLCKGE